MTKLKLKITMLAFTLLFLVSILPGSVFGSSFTIDDVVDGSTPAVVQFEITGDGTNSIRFDIKVLSPTYADIRAIFFDLEPFPFNTNDIEATGSDVTDFLIDENIVSNLGQDARINPAGLFDFGVEIGTKGQVDYIHSTTFIVSSTTSPLTLGTFFGVRLTSVGEIDTEGSSKVFGGYSVTPVPEPSSLLLVGTGLIGLVGLAIRKKK